MKKLLFSISMLLFFCGYTQELPEVVPPSPTVANLMSFEEVPVNNYTGQADISIPIFSKKISKNIEFGIGLKYNTSGVQLNSRSGWTGTGWTLFAGGSISRTVRDIPDEAKKGTTGYNIKTGVLHNSDYWNYDNLSGINKAEFNWKAVGSSIDKYDNNLDLYQFNFLGFSGRFVILKSGSTLVPKLISRNGKFQITIDYHSTNYTINSFTITDPNGYQYTFSEIETTTTTNTTTTLGQDNVSSTGTQSNPYSFRSAWHLTTVKNPKDLVLLTLNYASHMENLYEALMRTENKITSTFLGINDIKDNAYNNAILEPKYSVSQNYNSVNTKKLSTVLFRDGTSISLSKINGHPEYHNSQGSKLTDVILKDINGLEYKRYTMTYETVASRLWLTQVSEVAGSLSYDTTLNYHNRVSLPKFEDANEESDSWGYYSGIDDVHSINNPFDKNQIKTGLLTSITYPTGGVKEFEFEHNTYTYVGGDLITYQQYIENPSNTEYTSDYAYNHTYTNRVSSIPDKITNNGSAFSFTIAYQQNIEISSFIDYANTDTQYLNYHEVQVKNVSSGTFYGNVPLAQTGVIIANLPAGTYELYLASTGSILFNSYDIKANYRVVYNEESTVLKHEMLGGGVRIRSISFKDSSSSLEAAKTISFEYDDEGSSNPTKSSGVIDALQNKLKSNYDITITKSLYNSADNSGNFGAISIDYDVIQSGPNMNVQLSQGSYIGYKRVKVLQGKIPLTLVGGGLPLPSLENNIGYTIYEYTSAYDADKRTPTAVFNLPQATPSTNIDYKRGLLVKQEVYTSDDLLLKEVENIDYDFIEESITTNRSVYKPTNCEWIQFYDTWSYYYNSSSTSGAQINAPPTPLIAYYKCGLAPIISLSSNFNSGWVQLKETVTKDYYYDENNPLNPPNVVESRKTYSYNTQNYQIATENSYHKEKGVDVHYETNYYYPVGTHLSSNTATIINRLVALNKVNEVLETVVKKDNITINQTNTIYNKIDNDDDLVLPVSVDVGKLNSTPETRIEFLKYDEYENIVEVKQTDGMHITYIWGYNKTVPIAKIENSTFTNIPTSIYNDVVSKSNLDTNASGENNLRTALAALRNHANLANAMVTTFTYDPAKGVTSITDPRGRTSYFTYDAFYRLELVKDHDQKIVSENQYNYKN